MFTPVSREEINLNLPPFVDSEVQFNLFHKIIKGKEVVALQWREEADDQVSRARAIALQNPGFPMWLWVDPSLALEQVDRLIDSLCEQLKDAKITGFAAAPEVTRRFSEKYVLLAGAACTPYMSLESFHCPQVIAPQGVLGQMRLATTADIDTIAEFYAGFIFWGFGKTVTKESQLPSAQRLVETNDLHLWEVDGKVVTMTFISDRSPRHARINSVYTPEELRGKGYASALVAAVSQKVLDEGLTPVLFTDLSNPISNRVYKKIGYIECGKVDEVRIQHAE